MRDRDTFPGPRHVVADEESWSTREGADLVEQLISAARGESPSGDLEARVVDTVAYRKLLANTQPATLAPRKANAWVWVAATAGSFAIAAGVMLWTRPAAHTTVEHAAPESLETRVAVHKPAASAAHKPVPNPCSQRATAVGRQPLIDDFEDGDDAVLDFESRSGLWRWARDTDDPRSAPALLPIPRVGSRTGNRMALHVKGGRLLEWGAVVEFNFKPSCYDASVYRGLSFQAKGPGRIFVAPREVGTIPDTEGGTCKVDCYNPHVKKVELDKRWNSYRIEWSEFEQRGYGRPPFDPKQLHSIAFLIRTEDTPYDLWFDDVSFIRNTN